MRISARVQNSRDMHDIVLQTNGLTHSLSIPPKATGFGSSANGGELLFLALATCYCNDLYREASRRGIEVLRVDVTVEGEFGGEGEPAKDIAYSVAVSANATDGEVSQLMMQTDRVAEIQNTLRAGVQVRLARMEVV